jgi:hypothetical protein
MNLRSEKSRTFSFRFWLIIFSIRHMKAMVMEATGTRMVLKIPGHTIFPRPVQTSCSRLALNSEINSRGK